MNLLRNTSVWCLGASAASLALLSPLQAQSVFSADFEGPEYTPGILFSDPDWDFDPAELDVEINGLDSFSGLQSLDLSGLSPFDYNNDPSRILAQVVWLDFSVKPLFGNEDELPLGFGSDRTAITGFVRLDAFGEIYAVDGDGLGGGQWLSTGSTVELNGFRSQDWLRLTYRLDYSRKSWDLFVDGEMIAIDLGFLNPETLNFDQFTLLGDYVGTSSFDDFSVRLGNPLYLDADNDAIDDAYEIEHGLNTTINDRDWDIDYDRLSNLQEFLAGSSASNADTDGDGVHDGAEVEAGGNPAVADPYVLGTLPYIEDFESLSAGWLNQQGLWTSEGQWSLVQSDVAHSGIQSVKLDASSEAQRITRIFDGKGTNPVWIDYYAQPTRYADSADTPALPVAATAAYQFLDENRVRIFDGNGGSWIEHPHASASGDWTRVTRLDNYLSQSYQLWINGVRLPSSFGFASAQPFLNVFALEQVSGVSYLDDLSIQAAKPLGLDTDGDGLIDEAEDANGNGIVDPGETDPLIADTDGDGRVDSAAETLQLWLRADSGVQADTNGVLTQWDDQSIFKQHAIAGSGDEAPELISDFSNGQAAIRFDGVDDFLGGTSSFNINQSDYTLIAVQRCTSGHDRGGVISFANWFTGATLLRWGQDANTLGVDKGIDNHTGVKIDLVDRADELLIASARRSGGSPSGNGDTIDLRVLANETTWTASDSQTWQSDDSTDYWVGKIKDGNPNHFGGEILELRVYKGALSDDETKRIEAELAFKYGLTLDKNDNTLPDGWELFEFGRLLTADEEWQDPDNDGLSTFREYHLDLNPNIADDEGFPLNDSSLKLWLSAGEGVTTDAGGDVVLWEDISGNALRVLPQAGTDMPSLETTGFNGQPTVYFDGNEALVAATSNFDLSTGDYTIVAIHSVEHVGSGVASLISFRREFGEKGAPILAWKTDSKIGETVNGAAGLALLADVSNVDGGIGFATGLRRSGDLLSVHHEGYAGHFFESDTRDPSTKGSTGFCLGRDYDSGGKTLQGRISEVLAFDRALSDEELTALIAMLRDQYGIDDDIDGDGLLNLEEDLNANGIVDAGETDAENNDSDGDGLLDAYDPLWIADPLTDAASFEAQPDGSLQIAFSFDAADGYASGPLGGQQGWEAASVFRIRTDDAAAGSDQSLAAEQIPYSLAESETTSVNQMSIARHYLGGAGISTVWVSFEAKLQTAVLDEIDLSSNPALVLTLADENTLAVYDSVHGEWLQVPFEAEADAWVDYDLELNYTDKVWKLCIAGRTVLDRIPFVDPTRSTLEQFTLLQQNGGGERGWIDEIVISDTEPAELDFDGDGLDNATERSLGTDVDSGDTDGDRLPDAWEVEYGFNPLDPQDGQEDADNDGLSNIQEYEQGSDLESEDSDSDGFSDFEEWLAQTSLIDTADVPSSSSLPSPWKVADLGPVSPGAAYIVGDEWRLAAAGNTEDFTSFFYREMNGGYSVTFYIEGINVYQYARVGLMVRDSLEPGSRLLAGYHRQDGSSYQSIRTAEGGSLNRFGPSITANMLPGVYMRITRGDASTRIEFSKDRVLWRVAAQSPMELNNETLVGVYLCSRRGGEVYNRTSVRLIDVEVDTDFDGVSDADENSLYGTDPNLKDTDGDGISDGEEILIRASDPLVAEYDSTTTVASYDGSEAILVHGGWQKSDDVVYSTGLNGELAFDLNVEEPGIYELHFKVGRRNELPHTLGLPIFLVAKMDGHYVQNLQINEGGFEQEQIILTPYLDAGTHVFQLRWDNVFKGRSIQIESVKLEAPQFATAGERQSWESGILDAVEGVFQSTHTTHSSPFFLEGYSKYPGLVRLLDGTEVNGSEQKKWFASLDLLEEQTHVTVEYQNAGKSEPVEIQWSAMPLFVNGEPSEEYTLIKGSQLKLMLDGDSNSDGVINVGGVSYTLSGEQEIIHTFDATGQFTVSANVDYTNGTSASVEMQITVIDFPSSAQVPYLWLERSRNWKWSGLSSSAIVSGGDAAVQLKSASSSGQDLAIGVSKEFPLTYLTARTPDGRPFASQEVKTLWLIEGVNGYLRLYDLGDDTVAIESTMHLSPDFPEDAAIRIDIFKSGVSFPDGTRIRTITKADFTEYGTYTYTMLKPKSVAGSACHRVHIYQDGKLVGRR